MTAFLSIPHARGLEPEPELPGFADGWNVRA